MSKPIKLYDLSPSPNNIKVRCALAYKKIPYERIFVNPQDRAEVVKVSGQPLTPVLMHGETVVYDSYAIMRYLDANFPQTPRLYSAERDSMKKIEEWELFTRTQVGAAIGLCFGEMRAPQVNPSNIQKANEILQNAAMLLEEVFATRSFLLGEQPTAADFTVATMMWYGTLTDEEAKRSPVHTFFGQNLRLQGMPKTQAWIRKIMEWDK